MPEPTKRILIVEDEYYLAEDCAQEIVRQGMQVMGPSAVSRVLCKQSRKMSPTAQSLI